VTTTTDSPIQTLPSELLHLIYCHLDLASVVRARQTCNIFARIGLDHLGHGAVHVYHREPFSKLLTLANHPTLSKHVTKLLFQGNRLASDINYTTWDRSRDDPDPQHDYVEHLPDCDTSLP